MSREDGKAESSSMMFLKNLIHLKPTLSLDSGFYIVSLSSFLVFFFSLTIKRSIIKEKHYRPTSQSFCKG